MEEKEHVVMASEDEAYFMTRKTIFITRDPLLYIINGSKCLIKESTKYVNGIIIKTKSKHDCL